MPSNPEDRKRRNGGYSLIEVLIAMAMLGTVLLSIVTLFFFGRRNVYSGKQMTQAVAIGTHVLEDLSALNVGQIYTSFALNASSTLSSPTLFGVSYPGSLVRTTTAISSATETDPDGAGEAKGLLTTWKEEIDATQKLHGGIVTVVITPTLPGTTPLVGATGRPVATVIKIRVIVSWDEGLRQRHIIFDTTRTRRS
ncbi:MAG TPA: prepilin-type N-terminal cleavage/methylation domain-containing protein [Thermoanaerobaculia bacterium]|nr:prepilin-type N-terminal cleavage/methylation domain-containing protein [Thermoanaerobaculia bacterium]